LNYLHFLEAIKEQKHCAIVAIIHLVCKLSALVHLGYCIDHSGIEPDLP